jgi:putative transcriptional regulator
MLHNRVKEARLQHAWTQEELAGMVSITRQTIIAIEKGGYAPSVRLALRLAQALQVPIGDLFWLAAREGG